ncbi:DUF5681 domain-containing protein [Brevundimonas sp.]|uniref:DUF5681 domain-containing protein n=1 Tax=Brevundimonas sp. TaxID=1871086 RepID=UPI00289BB324|nr:DUF5681 domain-containing protein [Brevundimonas sp.]
MSESSKSPRHYEVGYGRPPQAAQFKPGQSGNPKGRPKGAKNLVTLFREELERPVPVTQNGRTRMMSKARVAVIQQVDKAAKGDAKAFAALMKYAQEDAAAVAEQAAAPTSELQPAEYDEIIARYIADLSEGRAA